MSEPQPQTLFERAQRLHAVGHLKEAEAIYRDILARNPMDVGTMHILGLALYQQDRRAEGIELIAQTVEMVPDNATFRFNYGNVLLEGNAAAATAEYRRALELQPDYPDAMTNLAVSLCKQNKFEDAIVVSRLVLAQRPRSPEAMFNLAQALRGKGAVALSEQRYAEAVEFFSQATNVNYQNFDAQLGLAYSLSAVGNPAAGEVFRQALALEPYSFEACIARARWLDRAQRSQEAIETYRRAIEIRADDLDAQADLAALYGRVEMPHEAIAAARRVLEIEPGHIHASATLGAALSQIGKNDEAAEVLLGALERSRAADTDAPASAHLAATERSMLAALLSNLFLLRHYEETYDPDKLFGEQLLFGKLVDRRDPSRRFELSAREKLRVGYVSGDFRRHAVAMFIEPILENHDPSRFEIFCYSNTEGTDEMTARLKRLAHHWTDITQISDDNTAQLISDDRIDILVDLSGHTGANRLPVFGLKPAPVQATYLGFPNSTGLPTIDYRISDPYADPPGLTERYHQEKLIRLPHAFFAFRPHAAPLAPSPAVSTGVVTFASLNVFRKVTPAMMRLWARILSCVPRSRLLMITDPSANDDVRAVFQDAGVTSDRLDLVQRGPLTQYFQRLNQVDIELDPYPYNGHTTTCDCLWMGVPVVTLAGNTSVTRSGVSILSNIGHPELIASTPDQYAEIATQLAKDLPRLVRLRQTLRDDMARSPITNAQQITRDLEAAYQTMWQEKLAEASR
jgi:predicted O-linked N-acetylglucosamine transferase (SPINDLY family)